MKNLKPLTFNNTTKLKCTNNEKDEKPILNKTTLNNIKEASKFNKKLENEMFLSLLKQTKINQQATLSKLKKVPVKQKLKLPEKISDIDRDPYLSSVLLKNPEFMNVEEKNFIESFNKKERIIFLQYLKTKSKEKNWMGNGYGLGNFLLDSKKSIENKKLQDDKQLPFFKQFLKGFLSQTNSTKEKIESQKNSQVSYN